jgi:hypothetical protein
MMTCTDVRFRQTKILGRVPGIGRIAPFFVPRQQTPLFDHARMAATLTSITRIPYDAQHLPFTTVRFVKKDTDARMPSV